jgi:phage shock protein PspC (stress-responsive transcriptional regulator)
MTQHAATYKELRRSRNDRMLAGVCGGLARYFDVNPTFYRVGFVVLTLLGGAGLLIYGAALLVMPDEGQDESIASEVLRDRRQRPWALVGLALSGVAAIVLLSRLSFHIHSGIGFWIVVLIAGAALLQWQQHSSWPWHSSRPNHAKPGPPPPSAQPTADTSPEQPAAEASTPPPTVPPSYQPYVDDWYARPRRGSFGITFGVLVVAGGVLGLLATAGVHIPWAVAIAVGAVAIGFGIVCGAVLGRRIGGLAFLGLVLVGTAVVASSVHVHLSGGIGNRTYTPTAAPRPNYRLGIGDLHLDLSNVSLTAPQTQVDARVGIGNLQVIVPKGVSVRVVGHAGAGDVRLLGHDANGHRVDETVSAPGGVVTPKLVIDARTDIGRVLVTRSVR